MVSQDGYTLAWLTETITGGAAGAAAVSQILGPTVRR